MMNSIILRMTLLILSWFVTTKQNNMIQISSFSCVFFHTHSSSPLKSKMQNYTQNPLDCWKGNAIPARSSKYYTYKFLHCNNFDKTCQNKTWIYIKFEIMCDYFAKEKKKVAKVTFFLYNIFEVKENENIINKRR